jgi:hypothetical protein
VTAPRYGDETVTHTLRGVRLQGRSFILAFRTKADAKRFVAFVQAHARECPQEDPSMSYRLNRDWELDSFETPPAYAITELDDDTIFGMVTELLTVRMGKVLPPEDEMTDVTCVPTPLGIRFDIMYLPPARLN